MGRPKRRRLGQNFLVDGSVAERIAGLLSETPPRVLEIGPGRGALTEPLLDRFERVLALEVDDELVPALKEHFGGRGLEVLHADALADDLDQTLGGEAPWQVASNLPYSVGTAILRRLLPRHDILSRLVVMLQREVAYRVVAEPGGKGHGLLALERAAFATARHVFDVHPRSFRPRPKIMSSVVVLDLMPHRFSQSALDGGLALASKALTKPRKMLTNAVGNEVTVQAIEEAEIDPSARPGTITLQQWVRLAESA